MRRVVHTILVNNIVVLVVVHKWSQWIGILHSIPSPRLPSIRSTRSYTCTISSHHRNIVIMRGQILLLFAALLCRVGAQVVPSENLPGYEVVQVLSDLVRVTDFVVTPENQLITVAKEGLVDIYDATTYAKLSTALDLTATVCIEQENGIQSITLHPDFANNRYLYIFWVRADEDGVCVYPSDGGNPSGRDALRRHGRCRSSESVRHVAEEEPIAR